MRNFRNLTLLLLFVLVACDNGGLSPRRMQISDANPVQFWVSGDTIYNDQDNCGVENACFCQPFQCSDTIHLQMEDLAVGKSYSLQVVDGNTNQIGSLHPFVETITDTSLSAFSLRATPADNNWNAVAYGNGLFVAVSSTGTGNRVMTSPDGSTWTIRTSAADNNWQAIAYGNGLFVAISDTGAGNRVMTSPNGITWTIRTSAANNNWRDVIYGNGVFVAVAIDGGGNNVMTSPDGITWTSRAAAVDLGWFRVAYGAGLFVAVSSNGAAANNVMTSPDGITWTTRSGASGNSWKGVTYGNGLFVATSVTGTGNRVMTSPNGITWTSRVSASDQVWQRVVYGGGLFVAIDNINGNIMTSEDGIQWTLKTALSRFVDIDYGLGIFAAVGNDVSGFRAMSAALTDDILYDLSFTPTSYSLCDGQYKFRIVDSNTLAVVASSDCLDFRSSQECTKLVTYSNDKDFAGLYYTNESPDVTFYLRVPAVFFDESFPEEMNFEDLSNSQTVQLFSEVKQKKLFEVGYMPYFMHKKLILVLSHNSVLIDEDYWQKQDAYQIDQGNKRYSLRKATALLTNANYIQRNVL